MLAKIAAPLLRKSRVPAYFLSLGMGRNHHEDPRGSWVLNDTDWMFISGVLGVTVVGSSVNFYMSSAHARAESSNPLTQSKEVGKAGEKGPDTNKEEKPKERFEDVIGIELVIEEMKEVVDFIKFPDKYNALGAELPRGILLTGPPGTGKTLLARALANEAGCTFLYRSGSDFITKYLGDGAERIRALFKEAREKAPAVIFIDEIDTIGQKREHSFGPMNLTINQLLTEMDGFQSSSQVLIIGATNRHETLDSALMRAGRFDKTIHVEAPNEKNREKMFRYFLSKVKADTNIDHTKLAREAIGMTGADISNMVNIAAIKAAREGKKKVDEKHLEGAMLRLHTGLYGSLNIRQNLTKISTYQAAKAVLILKEPSPFVDFVHATVLPTDGVPGSCAIIMQRDKKEITRADLLKLVDYNLIGRIMEAEAFGEAEVSQRATKDLEKATKTAMNILRTFDDRFLGLSGTKSAKDISSENLYRLEEAVIALVAEREQHVRKFVAQNKHMIERVAMRLKSVETLRRDDILKLMG